MHPWALDLKAILEIGALLFYGGANWQLLREHSRRIAALEENNKVLERVAAEHDFIQGHEPHKCTP